MTPDPAASRASLIQGHLRQLLFLPALTGVLGFASFPATDQGYLAWFAFTPLVLFVALCGSWRRSFLGGFVAGTVQMGGLLIWVPSVMSKYGGVPRVGAWVLYALLVALQAVYPAVACAWTGFLMSRRGEGLLLTLPFAWVTLEYVESRFPFGGFPWLLAGYSQTGKLWIMQIADLTAVYGVSFLILSANTAFAWYLLHRSRGLRALWPLGATGLLVGIVAVYGRASLSRWDSVPGDHTVAMLQQNMSIDESEAEMEWKYMEGYVKMADRLPPGKTDLLILPESPSPLSFQYDQRYRAMLCRIAGRFPMGMVFNNIAYEQYGGGVRYFNTAYFLNREGAEVGRYDKIHLVPFGEYVPLKRLFFFVDAISKDVSDFYAGSNYTTVPVAGRPAAVIICYEAVFPQLAREFVRRGAELLINLSNDSWYGDSAAPYQHLAMARWRAVENRRFLLRATNSGISAVIDPSGRIQVRSRLLHEDICTGRFAFAAGQTLYSRYGDAFVFLCAIISSSLGGLSVISRQRLG